MHRIGIDVGGTFTDVILVDTESLNVIAIKVPTTPLDPSIGVINGIQRAFRESSIKGNQVSFFLFLLWFKKNQKTFRFFLCINIKIKS